MTRLGGERHGSRSQERLREASQHRQVSVKPDALKAAHPKQREAVVVLQVAEGTPHGDALGQTLGVK
jgi:hypothetical protein